MQAASQSVRVLPRYLLASTREELTRLRPREGAISIKPGRSVDTLESKAAALLSAALRHTRDAETLLTQSPDQSVHLSGFGPECARKATVSPRWMDQILGHHLGEQADPLLELLESIDPACFRYQISDWSERYPRLSRLWNPSVRYEASGTFSEVVATELVSEARALVDQLVGTLWADGRLSEEFVRRELLG